MISDPGAHSRWLLTLADLVAILVAFFVLLFSMSSMDGNAWTSVSQALSQRLNPSRVWRGDETARARSVVRAELPQGESLAYLEALIGEKLRSHPVLGGARLVRGDDRLVLMLPSALLFAEGDATLSAGARAAIAALADALGRLGNRIDVVGHADPRSPSGPWRSNWALSLARASAVADGLRAAGAEAPIVARGRGAAAFEALPVELAEADRFRLARRVDVVVRAIGDGDAPL